MLLITSFDIENVDPDLIEALYGGIEPRTSASVSVEIEDSKTAWRGLSKTQKYLRRRGPWRPEWVWRNLEDREGSRIITKVLINNVSIVPQIPCSFLKEVKEVKEVKE